MKVVILATDDVESSDYNIELRQLPLTKLTFGHSAATVDSCRPLSRAINGRYVVDSGTYAFRLLQLTGDVDTAAVTLAVPPKLEA